MPNVVRITPELATAIHGRLQAEHGGPAGVGDPAALADALAAVVVPRGKPDLFALAADYAAEILARRPFVAGNARAAYAVCRTFLVLNGTDVAATKIDRVLAVRDLAAGRCDRAAFAARLSQPSTAGATAGRPTPVRRSVMVHDYACPRCGGTAAEPGTVHSTGKVYFRPANTKFMTLKTGDIELRANACTACGHVDFVADVGRLAHLTRRAEPV